MPRLLHASGRFDEPAAQFAHDLARWMLLASIITLTEVARPGRLRKLKRIARRRATERTGWTRTGAKGEGPGECAILSDRAVWKRRRRWLLALTKGGGTARLRRRLWLVAALLQYRAIGWHLLVLCTHMPAHVETVLRKWRQDGHKLNAQARAWLAALDSLAEHLADLRRAHPNAHVWVACDWNVDAGAEWARALVLSRFKAAGHNDLRIVAAGRPTLGGGRTVDFFVTDMDDAQILNVLNAKSSDHNAVLAQVA